MRDARANLVLTLTGRGVEATSSTLTFDASDAYIATGLLGLEAVANGPSRPRADWATWARARCEGALAPELHEPSTRVTRWGQLFIVRLLF